VFCALTSVGALFNLKGDKMEYSKDSLSQMDFHNLRIIAREVGVKAPSSKNKSVLVKEILEIVLGERKPSAPSKLGRPVKNPIKLDFDKSSLPLNKVCEKEIKKQAKKELIDDILKKVEDFLYDLL
jgi:hypothetical protein